MAKKKKSYETPKEYAKDYTRHAGYNVVTHDPPGGPGADRKGGEINRDGGDLDDKKKPKTTAAKKKQKELDRIKREYKTDKKGVTHIGARVKETPYQAYKRNAESKNAKKIMSKKEYAKFRKTTKYITPKERKKSKKQKRYGGSVSYNSSSVTGYSKKYSGMGGEDE